MSLLTLDLDDYHTNYSGLFAALTTNKHLRQAITNIHNMTDITNTTEPILLNPDAVLTPALESLTSQFLNEITPNTANDNLFNSSQSSRVILNERIKKAVNVSTLPKHAKTLINKSLNPNHDLDETDENNFTLAASPLNNYARRYGFSSFSQMAKIFKTNLDNEGERRGRNKQIFTCLMSPSDLAEVCLWQPQILLDDKSSPYKKLLFTYLKIVSASLATSASISTPARMSASASTSAFASTSASASTPVHTFSTRSITIQRNCLAIAAALLQNEPPTLSLNKLASISQHQVRFPPRRIVEKALRVRDLANLDFSQTFTCFWCTPLVEKDDSQPIHESLLPFQPELADVNSFRLHCFYTEKA